MATVTPTSGELLVQLEKAFVDLRKIFETRPSNEGISALNNYVTQLEAANDTGQLRQAILQEIEIYKMLKRLRTVRTNPMSAIHDIHERSATILQSWDLDFEGERQRRRESVLVPEVRCSVNDVLLYVDCVMNSW